MPLASVQPPSLSIRPVRLDEEDEDEEYEEYVEEEPPEGLSSPTLTIMPTSLDSVMKHVKKRKRWRSTVILGNEGHSEEKS